VRGIATEEDFPQQSCGPPVTLLEDIHLPDIRSPDAVGHLLILFIFFSLPFFLWTTLCLFLFFPFAFIFTSFVTHVCFSVFKIDLRQSWWVSFCSDI